MYLRGDDPVYEVEHSGRGGAKPEGRGPLLYALDVAQNDCVCLVPGNPGFTAL